MKENILLFLRENIRLILGAVVVLFILVLLLTFFLSKQTSRTTVNIAGQTFKVSVANTDKEKQVGLSETRNLGEKDGMLFVFNSPDKYSFWMRGMQFPIDIIYIKDNRVVYVVNGAPAPVSSDANLPIYTPDTEADKVLEINSGLAEKYNIKKGTSVEINNL